MVSRDLNEIFDDCTRRMAAGQSIDECLRLYPEFAERLRPLLETSESLRLLRVPLPEIARDQRLVWERIEARMERPLRPSRRSRPPYQLLLAAALFMGLVALFALARPDLPPDEAPVLIVTTSPTQENTIIPTSSATMTATPTATPTPSVTPTTSPSPGVTPSATLEPSATFAPGCGAPLTAADAETRVLAIYPNTRIVSVNQETRFGDVLVWVVRTSHQLELVIDVACGNILTIDQLGSRGGQTTPAPTGVDRSSEGASTPVNNQGGGAAGNDDDDDDDDHDADDDDNDADADD